MTLSLGSPPRRVTKRVPPAVLPQQQSGHVGERGRPPAAAAGGCHVEGAGFAEVHQGSAEPLRAAELLSHLRGPQDHLRGSVIHTLKESDELRPASLLLFRGFDKVGRYAVTHILYILRIPCGILNFRLLRRRVIGIVF